jgi:cytochrome c5
MRFSSGLGIGFAGVSACLLLLPWSTVSAKTQMRNSPLRADFRSVLLVPQAQAPATPAPAKTADIPLPDGEGKDLVIKKCSTCHETNMFSRRRYDKDHWNQILDNMTSKGMDATDAELDTIATYLTTNLGPTSPPAAPATAPSVTAPPTSPNK